MLKERYQVLWNVYGALAAVERYDKDGADYRDLWFLDYKSYDVQIRRDKVKFYYKFNTVQHVRFTFKIGLRITHQNILMAFNLGVAIYIVGKLLFTNNLAHNCLVIRCR